MRKTHREQADSWEHGLGGGEIKQKGKWTQEYGQQCGDYGGRGGSGRG